MCKGLASLPTSCLERAKELKARLGIFLQKPNWTLSCCKIGKNKPTLDECLLWKESFEKLLSSKYGLCAFTAFLVSEFSEENIAFYFACEDYRRTKCPAKLLTKAQKIYNEFISSEAPREVNIDHETRDITKANMQDPLPSCFDQAQHRIYMLMAKTATLASSTLQRIGIYCAKPNQAQNPLICPSWRRRHEINSVSPHGMFSMLKI